MGMFDTVKGIPSEYDDQFKCWEALMDEYEVGSKVDPILKQTTYSVQLRGSNPDLEPRFLVVEDSRITAVCSPEPLPDATVFDKWGRPLALLAGREPLLTLQHPIQQAIDEEFGVPEEPKVQTGIYTVKAPPLVTHKLRLRAGFVVELTLPQDLSSDEAARLSDWIKILVMV